MLHFSALKIYLGVYCLIVNALRLVFNFYTIVMICNTRFCMVLNINTLHGFLISIVWNTNIEMKEEKIKRKEGSEGRKIHPRKPKKNKLTSIGPEIIVLKRVHVRPHSTNLYIMYVSTLQAKIHWQLKSSKYSLSETILRASSDSGVSRNMIPGTEWAK